MAGGGAGRVGSSRRRLQYDQSSAGRPNQSPGCFRGMSSMKGIVGAVSINIEWSSSSSEYVGMSKNTGWSSDGAKNGTGWGAVMAICRPVSTTSA